MWLCILADQRKVKIFQFCFMFDLPFSLGFSPFLFLFESDGLCYVIVKMLSLQKYPIFFYPGSEFLP